MTYSGAITKDLLQEAIIKAKSFGYFNRPEVYADSGTENDNVDVNSLVTQNLVKIVLAQIDVVFRNYLVEAFFRIFKHRYLFYQELISPERFNAATKFYIGEHNIVIPHSALQGLTPESVFSGISMLEHKKKMRLLSEAAIENRIKHNRSLHCDLCPA